MVRHPRDIGFDEDGYDLPDLKEETIWLGDGGAMEAASFRDMAKLRRSTLGLRVDAIAKQTNQESGEQALVWCDYNEESSELAARIDGAVEVSGSMSAEEKASRMLGFSDGDIRVLVTKPKIAGFGMNWQNCNRIYFAGPSHSFESRYQAIRRCWRFGQTKPVTVKTCAVTAEQPILANLTKKTNFHEQLGAIKHG